MVFISYDDEPLLLPLALPLDPQRVTRPRSKKTTSLIFKPSHVYNIQKLQNLSKGNKL